MYNIENMVLKKGSTIREAMRVIDYTGTRMAVVVDDKNKLIGLITDGDIRRGLLNGMIIDEKINSLTNEIPLFAIENVTPEEEIWGLIRRNKILGIPLIDKDKIVKDFIFISGGGELHYLCKSNTVKKTHVNCVLVTGGAGYIGSLTVRILLAKGYKVTILDAMFYGDDSLLGIKGNPNLNIIKGDTRNISDVTKALKDVDSVVHLGELVGDPACGINPSITQEINYFATVNLGQICKHYQINNFVYISSCSVYGASKGEELLNEESAFNPVSLYAKMKISCERALSELSDDNFKPTFLRLGTVFGLSKRPRFDLVVNLLTAKALKEGEITIFGGNQWRPNVHVADVASTIVACLEAPTELVGNKAFNVGTEKNNRKIAELGRLIKKEIPKAELIIDSKIQDKRDYKVSFNKLSGTLGNRMQYSIEKGIEELKTAIENGLDPSDIKYDNFKCLSKNNLF